MDHIPQHSNNVKDKYGLIPRRNHIVTSYWNSLIS